MAIEASFTVKQADFPLSGIFERLSDVSIELDRIVPTDGAVIPYFWIYSDNENEFPRNLEEDVGVDTLKIIDEVDGQVFVRIDWNLDHESILTAIVNTDVTLLSGVGTSEQWTFEIRVSEQQKLSDFQEYCRDRDIQIELTQLHALSSLSSDREYDLTEGQRKALVLAYTRGHFDSPRAATQEDLADELGITRQAVSSRLQRGIRRLIASTLLASEDRDQ